MIFNSISGYLDKRYQWHLKTLLRDNDNPSHWSENLPLVMLSIRTALKLVLEGSALPYGFLAIFRAIPKASQLDDTDYMQGPRQERANFHATLPRTSTSKSDIDLNLITSSYVFVRV
ncbi:unnamed protein product [Dibothriocephalus latus]|uniref:Uncharacterized protein n=1 Tax=Dibothriocephalus latus TaxID=60516 RepID=A0A3P6QA51_DIBLA|nr:unnamed protein product [Dibothriocephalus latus]